MRIAEETSQKLRARLENLVLTGLMGAGKSTIGRLVAIELKREFVDTDEYIEKNFGPASNILNQPDGDAQFRQIEETVALELASKAELVISTGGRFMINQKNIDMMVKTGAVICLVADLDDIVNRLLNSHADTFRPRFDQAKSKIGLMEELQLQSEPYFSQFKQLQTSGFTPLEVTESVTNWFCNGR